MKKLVLGLLLIIAFSLLTFNVNADLHNDNLLSGRTYTHNGSNWYRDYSTDTNSKFLTDGILGGRYFNPDFYGVNGQESPVIQFDLTDTDFTFEEIHINFVKSGEAGITLPKLRVFCKEDTNSQWVQIYSGAVTDDDFVLRTDKKITASHLRFEFLSTGTFVFIKEIMAYNYDTPDTPDALLSRYNLENVISIGKSYTNTRYVDPNFPDSNNKELTDGVLGLYDEALAWTGTVKGKADSGRVCDVWPLYTTVIDLEKNYAVSDVKINFLRNGTKGYSLPLAIRIYASEDGENWSKIAYLSNIINSTALNGVHTYSLENMNSLIDTDVKARFVRVDFEPNGNHNLIDEIMVFGKDDLSSASPLTNLSKLENGEVMKVSEETGFIRDMALCYQHAGAWTKKRFKSIITYVDRDGKSVDTLFDAVLFLAQRNADGVRVYDTNNEDVRISDWHDYLNLTFGENGSVYNLNEAAKQASLDLNDPDYKTKYVVMIPYPANAVTEFGELNGKNLDLSTSADTKYLLDWYIDSVCEYVQNSDYPYLEFKGFYWMNEYPSRANMIAYANSVVKETGYKSYWIPYFNSVGYLWREDLGFDALTLQPNHFFSSSAENTLGAGGTKIIGTVAKLGALGNFGVEMEFSESLMSSLEDYNKGLDYLNGAVEYGFSGPQYFRNWYLGGDFINMIAYSRLPDSRRFYEYIYELMNGSYEIKPYLTEMNDNLLRGLPYTHNVTDSAHWYKDKTIDADCTFLTDGLAGGNFYGDRYLGVKNKDVTIDFDFDGKKAIKELHTYTFEDKSAALFLPENLKIYAKNDGELVLLYSGEVPSEHTVISLDETYYAEGLQFEFTRTQTFLFIKEVMAFSEDTGITPDYTVPSPDDDWLFGDVTNDGIINNADVMQINRKVANFSSVFDIEEYKEQRFKASDVNKDGVINNIDAMQINRKVANLGSVFDKK